MTHKITQRCGKCGEEWWDAHVCPNTFTVRPPAADPRPGDFIPRRPSWGFYTPYPSASVARDKVGWLPPSTYSSLVLTGPRGDWSVSFQQAPRDAVLVRGREPTLGEVFDCLSGMFSQGDSHNLMALANALRTAAIVAGAKP